MRHVWSLLAGLTIAPLTWLFLATGQHRSQQTVADWNTARAFDTADLIGPAIFLGLAGILLGLLGTLRWSPLGPITAGLLLVAPTVLMFRNPFRTLDMFSAGQTRRLLGQDFQPWLPVENGTLLVVGALLLMAVFSAQRWRRWPTPAALAAPAATTPVPAAAAAATPAKTAAPAAQASTAAPAAQAAPPLPEAIPITEEEILAAARAMEQERDAAGAEAARVAEPGEAKQP